MDETVNECARTETPKRVSVIQVQIVVSGHVDRRDTSKPARYLAATREVAGNKEPE